MKRSSDSIDRLSVKQITLESKNGSVRLSIGNDGKINFTPINRTETGSFSIDLKNEKISIKKIEFTKDNSSFTSSLNIGLGGSSISDGKFDVSTGRLNENYLPSDFNDIRQNAIDAIGKFEPSTGLLKDTKINPNIISDIGKGVIAHGKFDGITGKLPASNIHEDIINDIGKGIIAHGKFDINGKLPGTNIHQDVLGDITKGVIAHGKFDIDGRLSPINLHNDTVNDITKGITAHGKFDYSTGKLKDTHVSDTVLGDISKGVIAHGKFDINGKLPLTNLHDTVITDIAKGVGAHDDMGNLDFSLDNSNPDIPIIKISRGSRGFSSTTFSKNHIGLGNVENKNVSTIKNETFADSIFTTVQSTANTANSTANTIEGRFSGGKLLETNLESTTITKITNGNSAHNDLNQSDISIDVNGKIQFNRGGSRGSSTGTTITKSHVGLPLAENKSAATIVGEAFSDARFTNVSSSARDGLFSGSAARNFFDNSGTPQLKDSNTPSTLKNSNISLSLVGSSLSLVGAGGTAATFTNSTVGLGNVENKSVATIKNETFADTIFTTVQTTANTANTLSNTIEGRFSAGKLLETNLESTTITKITNGNSAHSDLNTADISIDASGKIQFNRGGSRGLSSGTTITKSHVGLPLAENKSAATIVGEALTDTRFTNVSSSARDGLFSGSAARNFFDNSATPQLKDSNTPSTLKNSNISLSLVGGTLTLAGAGGSPATFTKTTVGLDLVENKNVATIKNETFADTIFTSVQSTANTANSTANTINNRFDANARIKEDNSLNKRPTVIQYGSSMPVNPQIGDLVTVIGDGNFVGTTYMYGTRSYDLGQTPGDSGIKDFLSAPTNKTVSWNTYQNPYFTKTSSGTGILKFQYASNILILNGYSLYISPNSSIISIDRFYGQTKFIINYIPVTGTTYFTTNYAVSDVGNDGTSGDPALYFSIETSTDTFTNQTVYDSVTNNALGTAVSDWDGTFINTNGVDYKSFYFNANSNSFYRYRIFHNNITDATTTRRILVDKVTIEGWIPYDDTGVKSRLYELANLTSQTFSTFTGQHKCAISNEENIESYKTGLIVSSIGTYNNMNYENSEFENKITPQEAVPVVKLCDKKEDKSVIGVICKEWEMSKYNNKNFKADGLLTENNYIRRLEINSLGEGGIWVSNINGNLENGDYITTCEIPGYGMKQDDDLLHNYTVAKITCDCDFDLNSPIYICEEFEFEGKTYRRAFVGCTYHCG